MPYAAILGLMRDRLFLGAEFRRRRLALGLTLPKTAIRAGVSVSFLKYVEKGSQPGDNNAAALARAVEADLDDLTVPKPGRPEPTAREPADEAA